MILVLIEAGCRIRDTVLTLTHGPECPVCFQRHHNLTAHHWTDHASGDRP